jgi:hypothetical protein
MKEQLHEKRIIMKIRFDERGTFVRKQLREMRSSREKSVRRVGEGPFLGWTLLVITLLFFHGVHALKGNTDRDTKVIVAFNNPPTARYVRIFPRTWTNHISMRAGLLIGQATEIVPYTPPHG